MKKIMALTLALSLLLPCSTLNALAEDTAVPVDVDESVYAQLMENKWICDKNSDGVITAEELGNATQLSIDLDGITDLSWVSKLSSCHYLTFKNGTLTDFSALKQMPLLNDLEMEKVPLTDISFIKDLHLEICRLKDMDQITTAQKMEVLTWSAPDIWAGTAGWITCTPRGLTDYSIMLEDTDVAMFLNGANLSDDPYERIYGREAGTTFYSVSLDGVTYCTGELTVKENSGPFDAPLHKNTVEQFENGQSTYYNPDPDTGNSGLVTLVNGTLYSIRGNEIKIVVTDVADYEHVYKRNYKKSYNYADMVLRKDGILLVNGKPITGSIVKAMRDGYYLCEDGTICTIVPDGSGFTTATVTTDSKGWVEGCQPFYVTKDGHMKYYRTELTGEGKIRVSTGNTNIGEPISSCSLGSVCYVVDGGHTLYEVSYSTTLSKSKIDDDVVSVRLSDNGSHVEYTTKDGTVVQIVGTVTAGGNAGKASEDLGVEYGSFYIHEYQKRGVEENDAVFSYYIAPDRTMSLSFLGDYCGLTHVTGAIGSTYDTAQDQGYVYFLRIDGSIWKYNLDTKEWQEAVAEGASDLHRLRGDVNGDGEFDVSDVVTLQKWLLAVPDTRLADWKAGDFKVDERLDVFDLAFMKRELVGKENALKLTVKTIYGGFGVTGQDLGSGTFSETFYVKEGDTFYETMNGRWTKTPDDGFRILTVDAIEDHSITITSGMMGEELTQTFSTGETLYGVADSRFAIKDGINYSYVLKFSE